MSKRCIECGKEIDPRGNHFEYHCSGMVEYYCSLECAVGSWDFNGEEQDLKHIKDMMRRLPIGEDVSDKRNRWIGWIQGVLYAHDIKTIEELKEDVRSGNVVERIKNTIDKELDKYD